MRFVPARLAATFFACLALAGCVSFSETRWQAFTGAEGELCETASSLDAEAEALPVYFVTARLPDCRTLPYSQSIQRGDRLRVGRLAPTGTPEEPEAATFRFEGEASWWRAVERQAGRPEAGRTALVYVHGFNTTFDQSSMEAEEIRRYAGFAGPVIGYSWPSHERVLRYSVDETNQEWNQIYLTRIIARIAAMPTVDRLIIVAHSMGTRAAVRAVAEIDATWPRLSPRIRRLVLASSDMDLQLFEQQASAVLLSPERLKEGRTITIFTSGNDRAVGLSKFLHGYDRVGVTICADPLATEPCYARPLRDGRPIDGLTIYDTTAVKHGLFGHMAFLRSPVAREYFCASINGMDERTPPPYSVTLLPRGDPFRACADSDAFARE